MKRRRFQRSTTEHGSSAARTPSLVYRKRRASMDAVPAIEDQLRTLRPICSAQRVSTGVACGALAVVVAQIHAIDGCRQTGLSPYGDVIETLCHECLATLQRAMAAYVGDKREMACRCGARPVCSTCGRPTRYLRSVFVVRPIGPQGLAL